MSAHAGGGSLAARYSYVTRHSAWLVRGPAMANLPFFDRRGVSSVPIERGSLAEVALRVSWPSVCGWSSPRTIVGIPPPAARAAGRPPRRLRATRKLRRSVVHQVSPPPGLHGEQSGPHLRRTGHRQPQVHEGAGDAGGQAPARRRAVDERRGSPPPPAEASAARLPPGPPAQTG